MLSFLIFVILCFCAAVLGSIFTNLSLKSWYAAIKKPSWNPPNSVFAPVWSTLFLMMAIAGWMVWNRLPEGGPYWPIILFGIQLLLNIGWSAIFFGLRRPNFALAEIVILWVFIILTTISFWSVDRIAGILFLLYFLWVSFAIVINFAIWQLNK